MSSFDQGFYKCAQRDPRTGTKLLKAISMLSGILGGAMAGGGAGLIAKGGFQDSFRPSGDKPSITKTTKFPGGAFRTDHPDVSEDSLKDRALDHAPWVGTVLGGVLGGMYGGRVGSNPFNASPLKKLAFDQGFASRKSGTEKTALSRGGLVLKSLWESTFHGAGDSLGRQTGATFGDAIGAKRRASIEDKALLAAAKDDRFTARDTENLDEMAALSGVENRASEVAAGAGMLLGGISLLQLARPLSPKANWAAQVANRLQRKIQGPAFKPNLGSLALSLAAGSLATGFLGALASPIISQAAGSLAAKAREKDIVKGVERYYEKKATTAFPAFDRAKTAASVIGVMPGITSGLRTTKSFGKIRTARPVSGQSIGPRAKTNPVPSPSKSHSSGTPGAASTQVSSASLPKSFDYGSRLMGSWM